MSSHSEPASPRKSRRLKKYLVGSVLVLSIGAAGFFGVRFYATQLAYRKLQACLAELDAADPGWRLEDIEAAREMIPEEENSARVVVAVSELLPKMWPETDGSAPVPRPAGIPPASLEDRLRAVAPEVQLGKTMTEELRAALGQATPALRKARALADMPRGRHDIDYGPVFTSWRLVDQSKSREAARLLYLDAILLAQEEDVDKALASCCGAVNAGRSLGEPLFIAVLLRIACNSMAHQSLERILAQGRPTDSALRAVQELLENEESQALLTHALRGERGGYHRMLEYFRSAKDFPFLDSKTKTLFKLSPNLLIWNHVRFLKAMTEAVEIVRLPLDVQDVQLKQWTKKNEEPQLDGLLLTYLVPKMDAMRNAWHRNLALLRCAISALAAERYRLRQEHFPDSLEVLVEAGLLTTAPLDPFDAKPLRFRRTDDGILIYSIGPDRKDDGGMRDRKNLAKPGTDLGFQLWNPEKRRQVPAK